MVDKKLYGSTNEYIKIIKSPNDFTAEILLTKTSETFDYCFIYHSDMSS